MGIRKNDQRNFDTVCTALTQIFERTIYKAYHTGATNMVEGVWLTHSKNNIREALTPVRKT